MFFFFFFSSRRRHTRCSRDWSSDVCSSDLYAMPVGDMVSTETIGEAAAARLFGPLGSRLMSLSVLVSVFGRISATVISGPRVFYAMARYGLFFRQIGESHPRHRTPV